MNKEELVILVARKTNQPQEHIDRWLKHLTDIMKEALSKHETVRLLGFGTFTAYSAPIRPPIPISFGHPFRGHPATSQT